MATYYVRKTGSNGNPGTSALPKLTITGASGGISLLSAGDTLVIGNGTYNEQIMNTIPTGTSSNPITIMAENRNMAILLPTSPTSSYAVINLEGSKSYIIFDGLVVDGRNCFENGGYYLNATSQSAYPTNIIIRNGTIQNCNTAPGVDNSAPNGILINLLSHQFSATTSHQFINLDVVDCGFGGHGHGIYVGSSGNIVDGCRLERIQGYGIQCYNRPFLAENNTFKNNIIKQAGLSGIGGVAGILLSSGANNIAYNNIVYNSLEGIQIRYSTTNNKVYNNTIYGCTRYGMVVGPETVSTVIRNNISYGNGFSGLDDLGGNTNLTFDSTNLFDINPLFVNVVTGDFHLLAGSPAINRGATLTEFTTDLDGVTRS